MTLGVGDGDSEGSGDWVGLGSGLGAGLGSGLGEGLGGIAPERAFSTASIMPSELKVAPETASTPGTCRARIFSITPVALLKYAGVSSGAETISMDVI